MAATRPLRILFRFSFGLPYRRASDEEKKKTGDLLTQMMKKWKASGVKLIGYFGAQGETLDGFSHNMILAVDDVTKALELDADITGTEFGKYIERFSLVIGWGFPPLEELWKS